VGDEAPQIVFNYLNDTENNGTRQTVCVTNARVTFNNCILTENQSPTFAAYGPNAGGAQFGDPGSIIFESCEVLENLSTLCSTPTGADGLAWGYISARGCYQSAYTSGTARNLRQALDFDLNWQNQGRAGNGMPRLKWAMITVQNYAWPASGGSYATWSVALPIGAIPVKIEAFRAATTTASSYVVTFGTQANATAYGTGTGSNTNVNTVFSWDQTDTLANWPAPVTSANNQVVMTATGGTDAGVQTALTAPSNFAMVGYY
jgi:hypothetical protein